MAIWTCKNMSTSDLFVGMLFLCTVSDVFSVALDSVHCVVVFCSVCCSVHFATSSV